MDTEETLPKLNMWEVPHLCLSLEEDRERNGLFGQYCTELKEMGITYVWHHVIKANQSVSYITHKEWADRYLKEDYGEFDIINHFMFDRRSNFFAWRDITPLANTQQKMLMQERESDYQQFNGITIYLEHYKTVKGKHVITHRESMSLASDSRDFDVPDFCLSNYPLIRRYLGQFSHLCLSILK